MSMLFVTGKKIQVVPFDKDIIEKKTSVELPLYLCGIRNRKQMFCYPLSANSEEEFKHQVETKTAQFYICYSERDNHWDGYEELESFVISSLIEELEQRK